MASTSAVSPLGKESSTRSAISASFTLKNIVMNGTQTTPTPDVVDSNEIDYRHIIIGVVCGVAVLVFAIIIILVIRYQRKRPSFRRRQESKSDQRLRRNTYDKAQSNKGLSLKKSKDHHRGPVYQTSELELGFAYSNDAVELGKLHFLLLFMDTEPCVSGKGIIISSVGICFKYVFSFSFNSL